MLHRNGRPPQKTTETFVLQFVLGLLQNIKVRSLRAVKTLNRKRVGHTILLQNNKSSENTNGYKNDNNNFYILIIITLAFLEY